MKIIFPTENENQVGFVIPFKDNNNQYLVGAGHKLLLVMWDGTNSNGRVDRVLGQLNNNNERFNDGICDNKGRLFCGTRRNEDVGDTFDNNKRDGCLYKFTMKDGLQKLKDQCGFVGGLGFDQLQKKLFMVDSNDMKVKEFDFDDTTGKISECFQNNLKNLLLIINIHAFLDNEKILMDLTNQGQLKKNYTNGITLDQNDNIFVCMNGGGKILRINTK